MQQNKRRSKRKGSDTMSGSEISRNIYNITTQMETPGKRVCELEHSSDDSVPTFADDNEDINTLSNSKQNNKDLGRQPHISKRLKIYS